MGDDPVILRIAEAGTGRSARLPVPRWRAEAIVHHGLASWPRYEFRINPSEEDDVEEETKLTVVGAGPIEDAAEAAAVVVAPTPLGKGLAALAFVRGHAGEILALAALTTVAVAALLSIHLPSAEYRVYPVAILALVSFFSGFFAPRPPALPDL